MVVLVTCRNLEDLIKKKALELSKYFFFNCKSIGFHPLSWKPEFSSYLLENIVQSLPIPIVKVKFDQKWSTGLRHIEVQECE